VNKRIGPCHQLAKVVDRVRDIERNRRRRQALAASSCVPLAMPERNHHRIREQDARRRCRPFGQAGIAEQLAELVHDGIDVIGQLIDEGASNAFVEMATMRAADTA